MKLLLACVNSSNSLVGYDWDKSQVFCAVPSSAIQVCSVCYDGNDLLVASSSTVTRLTRDGSSQIELHGRYDALAHSIHVIDDDLIGVVDTGNSQIIVFNKAGELDTILNPVAYWGDLPHDAIHLNDFAVTPHGVLASCFDYRPWRKLVEGTSWDNWCSGGYGLILNLTGSDKKGMGRVVGCGFNHPHSLHYDARYLNVCSSATGIFHICEVKNGGFVSEKCQFKVTDDHFLRGAYRVENGWYLGGSSKRHGTILSKNIEIYHLDVVTGAIDRRRIDWVGEIYDVLPWRDEILWPIINRNFPQSAK